MKYYALLNPEYYENPIRIVEADTVEQVAHTLFYGGDAEAKPEQYRKDMLYPTEVVLFKASDALECPIEAVADAHRKAHEALEKEETEKRERAEFIRLKNKYGSS